MYKPGIGVMWVCVCVSVWTCLCVRVWLVSTDLPRDVVAIRPRGRHDARQHQHEHKEDEGLEVELYMYKNGGLICMSRSVLGKIPVPSCAREI